MASDTALTMPVFVPHARTSQTFDVFNAGQAAFDIEVSADSDWVHVAPARASVDADTPVTVTIDWGKAPAGKAVAQVWVDGGGIRIPVSIPTHNFDVPVDGHPFIETDGIVSFDASDPHQANNSTDITWRVIPHLGRTGDSITMFPVTSPPQVPGAPSSPSLEYNVYVTEPGTYTADVRLAPSLDFRGEGGLKYAISVNDAPPQILTINVDDSHLEWQRSVADYAHVRRTEHVITKAGLQRVKLWMVDPAVVFQHVTLARGPVPDSYLGPPPSVKAGN